MIIMSGKRAQSGSGADLHGPPPESPTGSDFAWYSASGGSLPSPSDGGELPPLKSSLRPQPGGTDPEKNQPKKVNWGPTTEFTLPPETLPPPPGREKYLEKVDKQRLAGNRDPYELTDADFPDSEWYSITPQKSPTPAPAPNYASGSRPGVSLPPSPSDGGKLPEKPTAPAAPNSASGSGSRPSNSLPPPPSDGGKPPEKPPAPTAPNSASGSGSRPGDSLPTPPSDGGKSPMWPKVWSTPEGTEADWGPMKNQPEKPTTTQWGTKTVHTDEPLADLLPEPPGRAGHLDNLAAQRLAASEPPEGIVTLKMLFSKFRPRSQRTVDTGA